MEIYALSTCDTCRKALREIRAAGLDPQVIDVRKDGVPTPVLAEMQAAFGPKLVNRSSATWRGLSEEERARDPLELLAENPTLMKRPVIRHDGQWFLGWTGDVRAAVIG
ncbi:arsenate reductase family protein [Pelagovum pacificum]|uniref:Arsenate reductase n=1 Tax=Pelagovum pacificum TaxID=2588711 RepID=A0A5C5G816_9RHOB|nr:ArsC/Spx/MgsR family protein [Pelagovum pacificum]QQA41624.1 arsenate reductase [Pelagovum pacificum]TNY30903.1 arsenate reductase [Pelagovum pacificum]